LLNSKICSDQVRAVVHGPQTHAFSGICDMFETDAVISNSKHNMARPCRKHDRNRMRMAVFDRIVDCLLRDAVQMRGYIIVFNQYRAATDKTAIHLEQFRRLLRQFLKGRYQTIRLVRNGV
jgi:hypothetical protein